MKTIKASASFFNIQDTLLCGQVFRFTKFDEGYLIYSADKCAYCYTYNEQVFIEVEDCDYDYFYNYFDLNNDYYKIYESALNENVDVLTKSLETGKGIRILNQDKFETIISFIISQNNNIKRIKGIIEKLCIALGEKKLFNQKYYYAFPTVERLAKQDLDFYYSIGLGYRAPYIKRFLEEVLNGYNLDHLSSLSTNDLKKALTKIYGIGPKVADCISLFGYHRTDSFPVDTWIEKVYKQDFKGKLKDRNKIAEYFVKRFKDNSGYYQQYLFYYKRSIEKS